MTTHRQTSTPVADTVAAWLAGLRPDHLPAGTVEIAQLLLLDVAGLCIAARREPYVTSTLASVDGDGPCTILGHEGGAGPFDAALVNGTAAHGEDFDNTFEGCPIHWGAVIVPAVLAAAEESRSSGAQVLRGLAVGGELMCRLGLVAQKGVHAAGFHPTAVLGAVGATAAVAATLELTEAQTVNALGIAGSMASGIIEYLADGSWTKRMHAGWAAQSGIRAALMGRAGFTGPATVFEGTHGLMHGFAPSVAPDFEILHADLGTRWHVERTAFKPYACGTMTQPFVDCAIRLARRIDADAITALRCNVGDTTEKKRSWQN